MKKERDARTQKIRSFAKQSSLMNNRPIQFLGLPAPVLPHYESRKESLFLEENNNEDDCAIFRTVGTITFIIVFILPPYIVERKWFLHFL